MERLNQVKTFTEKVEQLNGIISGTVSHLEALKHKLWYLRNTDSTAQIDIWDLKDDIRTEEEVLELARAELASLMRLHSLEHNSPTSPIFDPLLQWLEK